MTEARNHHYVPQAYLRSFAVGEKRKAQTFVVDRETRKAFPTLVRNIGSRRDFNRIDVDEHGPNALEDAYGVFDNQALIAIQNVARALRFDGENRTLILNLVSLLAVRTPRMRGQLSDFNSRIWKKLGHLVTATPERLSAALDDMERNGHAVDRSISYEKMRSFVERDEFDVVTHRHAHIRNEVLLQDKVLTYLFDRKWRLCISDGQQFITSDHPVCLLHTAGSRQHALDYYGYASPNTAVLFPLTPSIAIYGAFEIEDAIMPVATIAVAAMNGAVILGADRQVYSREREFVYMRDGQVRSSRSLLDDWTREALDEKP